MSETAKDIDQFLSEGGVNDGGFCPNCHIPLSLVHDKSTASKNRLSWWCPLCNYAKPANPTFIKYIG